ncbi:unnamed protein product [Blepharisma stoltei]|uniref:Uncharacterized protein n=1 Tax=Blepharisma stoltei TaxID=1481888 RepID=A0AAU9JTC4_9CILI|nr:unnamed protein product [Blepharisma stoltei]
MKINLLIVTILIIRCLLADKSLRVVIRCPYLELRQRLSITSNGWYIPWLNSENSSTRKIFTDHYFMYNFLKLNLPNNEFCSIEEPDQFATMNPSAMWIEEKKMFLAVVRININRNKSFLWASWYDSDWKEVITEEFIGNTAVPGIIPIKIPNLYLLNAGPEDPRIFRALGNQVFVLFNMFDYDEMRKMWIYNFNTAECYPLSIRYHKEQAYFSEKNWTPFIVDDEHLYFIYNYKNFQIIDCTVKGENCSWKSGGYERLPEGLRGGSPYLQYKNTSYYVNLGYSHIFYVKDTNWCHLYRPCLTLAQYIDEEPNFRLIYTSEPIDFSNKLFLKPITKYSEMSEVGMCGDGRIMIPLSIARWNYEEDIADITVSINDTIPLALKVSGLAEIVDEVIFWYEKGSLPKEENCAERLAYWDVGLTQPQKPRFNVRKIKPNSEKP